MRGGLLLILIAGCGRIGFGAIGGGADSGGGVDSDDVVPDGLVAYYDMETFGATGILLDNTGRGHTGTCVDPQCPIATGGHDSPGALTFDGIDDEVVIDDAADLHTSSALSIAMWVFVPFAPTSDFACVVSKVFGDVALDSYQLCVTTADAMSFGAASASLTNIVTAPNSIDANGWHHIVATWDGTMMSIYLDGALITSQASSPFEFDNGPLVLGIDLDMGQPVAPFTGTLDELRIYNRVLLDSEIATLAAP